MATAYANASGQYQVQFTGAGGKRETIYLGRVPKEFAVEFGIRVDRLLQSASTGFPPDPTTLFWLGETSAKFRRKLAKVGLWADMPVSTIDQLCDYCIRHADVEPSTMEKYFAAKASLVAFFSASRPLHQITNADCIEFRAWLLKLGRRPTPGPLKPTTVSKRLEQASLYFAVAVRKRWLLDNPFNGVVCYPGDTSDRMHFVTQEAIATLMAAADPEMRLCLGLARYLGLRIPSEFKPLQWDWIDWENGHLKVMAPKTKRFAHKKWRYPPLFPQVRDLLWDSFEAAPTGSIYMMTSRTITATAWRNRLERLCKKTGIESWPKIWQNMRSTRETELIDEGFPIQAVTAWIGNSPDVAIQNYLQITKDHHHRAIGGACSELQILAAKARAISAKSSASVPKREDVSVD
jgi:integrase